MSSTPLPLWILPLDVASAPFIVLVGVLSVAALLFWPRSTKSGRPLPPSPRGLPIVGHTHLMSGVKWSWRTFHEYSTQLKAEVMYFRLGMSDVIVISSCKAASELLEKKSAIYSDRPRLIVPGEYISTGRRMVLMPYGDKWRKMRRFLHAVLHDKMAATYEPVQDQEAKALILSLLENPKEYADHIQLFSSNIILQVAYGRRAESVKDDCIRDMIYSIETWSLSALPGAHLVQDFPMLEYLPNFINTWRKPAQDLHHFEMALYKRLTAGVRAKLDRGESPECIMRYLIQRQEEFGLSHEDGLYLAGTLFEAGSDTTTSLITSLFLACTADPKIALDAQAEVDRVVGSKRMPTFADCDDMPLIEAIAKELQRWRPAVPSAVPHALAEDDEYMGYHLPKGATVICNTWAIGRDPLIFPDGEVFRPSRYLGEEGRKITAALHKGHTGYGHARRICPGMHVADRSLFITISLIFWAFNVGPVAGEPLPDVFNFTEGFVSRSHRFNVDISVRSPEKATMIRSEGLGVLREMESLYE